MRSAKIEIFFLAFQGEMINATADMLRNAFLFFLLTAVFHTLCAQQTNELISALAKAPSDSSKINIQLALANQFLSAPGEEAADLAKCERYLHQAEVLCQQLNLPAFQPRIWKLKGTLYVEKKDYVSARKIFGQTANFYGGSQPYQAAKTWEYFGDLIRYDDRPLLSIRRSCFTNAYNIYSKYKFELDRAHMLGRLCDVELNDKKLNLAEKYCLDAIAQYQRLHYIKIYTAYYLLGEIYYRKNQFQKHLLTRIEMVNSYEADPKRTDFDGITYYFALAGAFYSDKNFNQSLLNYQKLVPCTIREKNVEFYHLAVYGIVRSFISLKRFKEAADYLALAKNKFPVKSIKQQAILISVEMKLSQLMKTTAKSRALIPKFKSILAALYLEAVKDPSYYAMDNYITCYEPLPAYYLQQGDWKQLNEELVNIRQLPDKNMSVLTKIRLMSFQYKLDSATGKLLDALKAFQQISIMRDSITNAANTNQINELSARYHSINKDKTIQQLHNQSAMQQARITSIHDQRNIVLLIIIVVVMLSGLLLVAYRGKQRSNRRLEYKQLEINQQNNALSELIVEKEQLLEEKELLFISQKDLVTEKEWLVKEIHHRVKNNLQIIMSLLYTQAAYLKNNDAVAAIRDVQHRVQAIAIIHQKLFTKTGVSTVIISEYLCEMVSYLSHSYNSSLRRIKFKYNIDSVSIGISQAVPIGLIVNEAITNAIKYAFDENGGTISIMAEKDEQENIKIVVVDNGVGLKKDFNLDNASTMGMEMMKALTGQLGGRFQVCNDKGVKIEVSFLLANVEHDSDQAN